MTSTQGVLSPRPTPGQVVHSTADPHQHIETLQYIGAQRRASRHSCNLNTSSHTQTLGTQHTERVGLPSPPRTTLEVPAAHEGTGLWSLLYLSTIAYKWPAQVPESPEDTAGGPVPNTNRSYSLQYIRQFTWSAQEHTPVSTCSCTLLTSSM